MNILLWAHIAGGLIAVVAGFVTVGARKGSRMHMLGGTWFVASMLVLGVSAAMLVGLGPKDDRGIVGILTCYFVATSWVTARRRDGTTGKFEIIACAVALGAAAGWMWYGLAGASTPAGPGPIFVFAGVLLVAGLGDLNVVLRKKLTAAQRLSRHLWRMCFAFFIATGSFFLGQQDVLPAAMRGSPILFVLAFAPFAVMAFWLVRLRFPKSIHRLALRIAPNVRAPVTAEAAD